MKIFGRRRRDEAVRAEHEQMLDAIAATGVAVEVSTAGLRWPVGEIHGTPEFLAGCRRRHIGVTTASGAYVAEDAGRDFPAALEILAATAHETVTAHRRCDGRHGRSPVPTACDATRSPFGAGRAGGVW